MLWHLADALHFDRALIGVLPLVNAVFDIAFHHGRPTKSLEVQLVVFPDRRRMGRAQAKRPWADVPWLDIEGRFCRCMIMYDPKGGDDDTITTLFNTLNMVGQFWVNALPQAANILCAFR
jgi:hypothetical protein